MRTYFYIAFMMVFFISMAVNCKPQSFAADGVNTGNTTTWFLDLNHTHTHKDQPEKTVCLQPGTAYGFSIVMG